MPAPPTSVTTLTTVQLKQVCASKGLEPEPNADRDDCLALLAANGISQLAASEVPGGGSGPRPKGNKVAALANGLNFNPGMFMPGAKPPPKPPADEDEAPQHNGGGATLDHSQQLSRARPPKRPSLLDLKTRRTCKNICSLGLLSPLLT